MLLLLIGERPLGYSSPKVAGRSRVAMLLSLLLIGLEAFAPPQWRAAHTHGAASVHLTRVVGLAMDGGGGGYARGGDDDSLDSPVDARRVDALISDRNALRRERRFDEADAVRAALREMNVKLHDKDK